MNSLIILLVALVWILSGYYWYGRRKIQNKLMAPLDKEPTPAHSLNDGMDYSPAPMLVLFGHHFSSIAGAGPIVGPIIAVAAFGWGPSIFWLLIGGLFIGAVHDYLSLMISVRSGGSSIPDTADKYVSPRARLLFLLFVWLALILVIAVFAAFAAQIMFSKPEVVIPTILLIPLSILFGILLKKSSLPLAINTVMALAGLVLLIWLGYLFPISFSVSGTVVFLGIELSATQLVFGIWFLVLMIYAVAASITPVWILLQPRDYISSWVLIIGVILALAGVVVSHPPMQAPFITSFMNEKQGTMFPFLFIIIACGAVSGFHSIVAGGTTSKQLKREKHALPVSFGAMLAETLIGTISVIIAGGAIAWAGSTGLHGLLNSGTPLGVYGAGFGKLTAFLFGNKLGGLIGITIINIFIMTTLDTSVRLTRFLTGEMIGPRFPALKDNKFVLTLIPVIPALLLGISGKWKAIWPVFGSANQLVAALALIIITAYLYSKGKTIKYTIWATLFMLITTVTALALLARKFLFAQRPNFVLGILAIILIGLAVLMVAEGLKFIRARRQRDECPNSEE